MFRSEDVAERSCVEGNDKTKSSSFIVPLVVPVMRQGEAEKGGTGGVRGVRTERSECVFKRTSLSTVDEGLISQLLALSRGRGFHRSKMGLSEPNMH